MKKILTIAGSDSGGGAGVQADLKTIAALGGHGLCVITALTAQNSWEVRSLNPVPVETVESQLGAVVADGPPDSIKVGMLGGEDIVRLLVGKLADFSPVPLVLDPVLRSSSGSDLLSGERKEEILKPLFSLCTVITPNLSEASLLCGMKVNDISSMKEAGVFLHRLGAPAVLVKGGHLDPAPTDVLFDGTSHHEIPGERIPGPSVHGTGCVLSSAIAVFLAQGKSLLDAATEAKLFVGQSIREACKVGEGAACVQPTAHLIRSAGRSDVLAELDRALATLCEVGNGYLVPEVQSNFAYGSVGAESPEDVAGFPGRIVNVKGKIRSVGLPEFGGSKHIGRIVLTAMRVDPEMRCCLNIRYKEGVEDACHHLSLTVGSFDRADEPNDVQLREGSSLEWGTEKVLSELGSVPDVIFDRGHDGKEPMIRVLGKNPEQVVATALRLCERLY